MTQPVDPARNRSIRVFVSSTFRDMVEEREALMSHTWPALRQFCREREVEFVEVDLRWGIPEEQATRKHMLKHCLDEVRACRPYFIGLLGERYGWIPGEEAFTADLLEEEPWLNEHRQKSVTELEITHGIFNSHQETTHVALYLRDPAYAQTRGVDYLPENEEARAKQVVLKDKVCAVCSSRGVAIHNYSDPLQLANLVLTHLQSSIEIDFPRAVNLDPLEQQARDHDAFAAARRRSYISRPDALRRLDQHALSEGEPLVLLGESGSGKSALLANWSALWRKNHAEDLVIEHYVGSTPDSSDHWNLMRRVITEIKRWTGDSDDLPSGHDELLKYFPLWLAKARSAAERRGVRCIIILDALNQLAQQEKARFLTWIPAQLLKGTLRFLVSTSGGETQEVLEQFLWPTHRVSPLTPGERRQMIVAYLERFRKRLDIKQIDRIADAPDSANPLYVKIVLDELRVVGTHDHLDKRLTDYLSAFDIPSLLQIVLVRYERDYEKGRSSLVRDSLCLIWATRRGLSEGDLLAQLSVAHAQWAPLYMAMTEALVDRNGVIQFAHDHFRKAVEHRYLSDMKTQYAAHEQMARYLEASPLKDARWVDELLWQLGQMQDWGRLARYLTEAEVLSVAWHTNEFEVRRYWVQIEQSSTVRLVDSYAPVMRNVGLFSRSHVERVAVLCQELGYLQEAWTLWDSLSVCNDGDGAQEHLQAAYGHKGLILQNWGRLDEALKLHRERADLCWRESNIHGLQQALGHQAIVLAEKKQFSQAMALLEEKVRICQSAGNEGGLQSAWGNQAAILQAQQKNQEAMALFKQQEQICVKLGKLDSLAHCLGNQAIVLKNQGLFEAAELLHKREEQICREIGDKVGLSVALGNRAGILKTREDLPGAWACLHEQEVLCRQLRRQSSLAGCLTNQATIRIDQHHFQEALALLKEAESLYQTLGDQEEMRRALESQKTVEGLLKNEKEGARSQKGKEPVREMRTEAHSDKAMLASASGEFNNERRRFAFSPVRPDPEEAVAAALGEQAAAAYDQRDLRRALDLSRQQEEVYRKIAHREGLNVSRGNQAIILQAIVRQEIQTDHNWIYGDEAKRLLEELAELCDDLGEQQGLAFARWIQFVALFESRQSKGLALHQEGLQLAGQLKELWTGQERRSDLARLLGLEAALLSEMERIEEALASLRRQEQIAHAIQATEDWQRALENQVSLLKFVLDRESSGEGTHPSERYIRFLMSLEDAYGRLGNQKERRILLHQRALLEKARGHLDEALQLLRQEARLCEEIHDDESLSWCLCEQSIIYHGWGCYDEAHRLAKQQEELCHTIHFERGLALARNNRAELLHAMGRPTDALPLIEQALQLAGELQITEVSDIGRLKSAILQTMGRTGRNPTTRV